MALVAGVSRSRNQLITQTLVEVYMTAFDPTQFAALRKVFPELSVAQNETALLFSMGIPYEEIAHFRHISVRGVRKSLYESMEKLSVFSLNTLRSVILIRLFLLNIRCISMDE